MGYGLSFRVGRMMERLEEFVDTELGKKIVAVIWMTTIVLFSVAFIVWTILGLQWLFIV